MYKIPVVDLFAGPGGLSEGFHAHSGGGITFSIDLSIEKDPAAHRTLLLRSFFRQFSAGNAPEEYYSYIQGRGTSLEALLASNPPEAEKARRTAVKLELGASPESAEETDRLISDAVGEAEHWVLLGGPPCQAYSLAGRARHSRTPTEVFEADHRHFLYKEYLRVLERFRPSIFVMENVKGLLTAKHAGQSMFGKIWRDLRERGYHIYSLTSMQSPLGFDASFIKPEEFLIRADQHGIPQRRERIILLGIRADLELRPTRVLPREQAPTVQDVIGDLPPLRATLSREPDSPEAWRSYVLKEISAQFLADQWSSRLSETIDKARSGLDSSLPTGARFVEGEPSPAKLRDWYVDSRLGGFLNHEARSHMGSDFARYFFVSCFGAAFGQSPKLRDFPPELLPDHRNVKDAEGKTGRDFADRFKVHVAHEPSGTIVSHIAKDGHYYIHYDPCQCRTLTVREVARLQTFPDNYFFEGNRTEQYTQVGNAVPPLLAYRIADIVAELLASVLELNRHQTAAE